MTDLFASARKARDEKYRRRAVEVASRVSRGESWESLAEEYGVRDVKQFRRGVRKRVGEVGRRGEVLAVLSDIEEAFSVFRERLEEIRRNWE